ncbi:DUF2913 family protein [Photobacterium carnosum]|uniref:DUF2913 family protein n=1 Tax=Photobacterium carnosum TaxID=2023717 RepID=UPI001E54F0A5|nr:DUF2913 family protein [Photobacterium carnosum]MCD9529552.1 DUF2913 family protein [Photobacterium carnosum]MCD9556596.1 DUF2913 family protein [Photobacterium carnosum]MCF2153897.1 DUF2913 family protein [Photobacterium carnosum]MCF2215657.1 DUF2913 family protein [Photobacterium carnosum]
MNQSQQLLDISTNALLHLEFKKLDKRLTQTEQNNLLVQYLKKIIKNDKYRTVKKSTKSWLLRGRKVGVCLESILNNDRERILQTSSTDLYRFVELIEDVEAQLHTQVQYSLAHNINLNARFGKVLVCVVDEDLTSSFDDDGLMIKSTQLLFIGSTEHKDIFSAAIDQSGYFQSVIAYEDESHLRVELFRL